MTTQEYIYQTLAEFAIDAEAELKKMLGKFKIKQTEDLLKSLSYEVYKAVQQHAGKYALSFKEYGRFVDMGKGRMSKIENVNTNGRLITARKPKKWYSRTMYGMIYGKLMEKLIVNLQEQSFTDIKHAFGK